MVSLSLCLSGWLAVCLSVCLSQCNSLTNKEVPNIHCCGSLRENDPTLNPLTKKPGGNKTTTQKKKKQAVKPDLNGSERASRTHPRYINIDNRSRDPLRHPGRYGMCRHGNDKMERLLLDGAGLTKEKWSPLG